MQTGLRMILAAAVLCTMGGLPGVSLAGEQVRSLPVVRIAQACEEVISCGLKDGKWRQYPTPCAARDDGATNVHPKTGPTCGPASK